MTPAEWAASLDEQNALEEIRLARASVDGANEHLTRRMREARTLGLALRPIAAAANLSVEGARKRLEGMLAGEGGGLGRRLELEDKLFRVGLGQDEMVELSDLRLRSA